MPEDLPPGLPPRMTPPSPPTRSFTAALGAAAGRKRRRIVGISGTALAVLLAAAATAVLPATPGTDRLSVAAPTGGTTAEPTAATAPAEPQTDAEPSAPPEQEPQPATSEAGPRTAAPQEPAPEPTTDTAATEEPEPTTAPRPSPDAEPTVGPPSEMVPMRSGEACDGSGPTPAQGWCSYYDGALRGAAGEQVVLATNVCRLPGQAAGRLTTPDGQHARFHVGGRWNWHTGRRFSTQGTTFEVQPGQCVRWFVSWNVTNDEGDPLPPGDYYLEALPRVRQGEPGDAYLDSTETFTVTR